MKRQALFPLLALALFLPTAALGQKRYTKDEAKKILKKAEEIRCLEKAEVGVDLTNLEGKTQIVYDLTILNSTERLDYVEFLAPQEERGRKMLAQGRNYWSTFPDSKRIVTISKREMIGNSAFAMADIFQLDADNDYDPEVVGEEMADKVKLLKLDLKAKHDDVPYVNVKYWVEEPSSFPVKAEFYGLSGKLLKVLTVQSRKEIGGLTRPEVSKMEDSINKGHVSYWKTKSMIARDVPDSVFTKEYLKNKN